MNLCTPHFPMFINMPLCSVFNCHFDLYVWHRSINAHNIMLPSNFVCYSIRFMYSHIENPMNPITTSCIFYIVNYLVPSDNLQMNNHQWYKKRKKKKITPGHLIPFLESQKCDFERTIIIIIIIIIMFGIL